MGVFVCDTVLPFKTDRFYTVESDNRAETKQSHSTESSGQLLEVNVVCLVCCQRGVGVKGGITWVGLQELCVQVVYLFTHL